MSQPLVTGILYFGRPLALACDARCDKAWGLHNRPRRFLSKDNPDDHVYLGDDDLGQAPEDPGTYEGGHAKPRAPEERHNRWCARECERSVKAGLMQTLELPDLRHPRPNIPR